jgi:hypothetical protein
VIDSGITPIAKLGRAVEWRRSRSFVVGESLGQDDVHGTEMASIIHAAAPSAHLLILKALDDQDGGSQAATAEAIRYAVGHGARVINLSAAGAEPSTAIHGAIIDADRHNDLVVVAAGNFGLDDDIYPTYPASDHAPNLIAVAATDASGNLAANSDWGARTVALGAPGSQVPADTPAGSETAVSGTSPAAALASAFAARLLSTEPNVTAATLRSELLNAGLPRTGLQGITISGRQLVRSLMATCAPRGSRKKLPVGLLTQLRN